MIEIKKYCKKEKVNKDELWIYEAIMRKFELHKKVYAHYDVNFNGPVTTEVLGKSDYINLVIAFYNIFSCYQDIRFYNTALKIIDRFRLTVKKIEL